jgi:hypothetical protein
MWTFDQSSGNLSHNGKFVAKGYSGREIGKNNPAMQDAVGLGPIPRGKWIIGAPRDSLKTGPYTLDLSPAQGTDTRGRSAFRIHGESIAHPGQASHGCLIFQRKIREAIWASGDRDLEVIE